MGAVGLEGGKDAKQLTGGRGVYLGVCLLGADPDDLLPGQGL